MKKSKQQNKPAALPQFFKNPFYPACVMAVLDILSLAAAIVYRQLREKLSEYYLTDGKIVSVNPADSYGGAALAVLLGLSAVIAGFMIAGVVIKSDRWDKSPVGGIFGALAMLAVSVGVVIFSLNFARGEQPQSVYYSGYEYEDIHLVVAEERYRSSNSIKVYQVFDDNCAKLCAQTQIAFATAGSMEDRYSVAGKDNSVTVAFSDGDSYRNIKFELLQDDC